MSVLHLRILCFMFLSFLPALPLHAGQDASWELQVTERLRQNIETAVFPSRLCVGHEKVLSLRLLPAFYEHRGFVPAWTAKSGLLPAGRELLAALSEAELDGLRPRDYHSAAIEELSSADGSSLQFEIEKAAELDLLLTDAFLLYATHLVSGRLNPETLDTEWHVHRGEVDLLTVLEEALNGQKIREALRSMLPQEKGYWALRDALARYRELSRHEPPLLPSLQAPLKLGMRHQAVPLLRSRLLAFGDIETTETEGDIYDLVVEQAVRRFQSRHGLEADGICGSETVKRLNISFFERAQQIAVNLERWRWLPRDFGDRYLLVNIADFSLDVVERGDSVLRMKVIIGRSYRRTPVFTDRMTYLVLNPLWYVPKNLAVKDKLPLIQKDPGFLQRLGYRVMQGDSEVDPATIDWTQLGPENFPYRLIQWAGPLNALGAIKFMFPNEFGVYLHDTPDRDLFAQHVRTFSSGCIRIEKPLDLAVYLLKDDPVWNTQSLEAALASKETRTISLKQPINMHLLYWTTWVDGEKRLNFRDDVYGRDLPVLTALESAPPDL